MIAPKETLANIKAARAPEGQCETLMFLREGRERKAIGGLRTRPHFQKTNINRDPLITVITVVLNGEEHLEKTIRSVINQTYYNFEYLVIDGGSTDGTLEIIRKYEYAIDYWVSERDEGIYDAMNKGSSLAFGRWVNFLNAGDRYVAGALAHVKQTLDDKYLAMKYLVKTEDDEIRIERASVSYLSRHMLNHQGIFYNKKALFNQFDSGMRIASDFKHLVEYKLWRQLGYNDFLVVDYLGGGAATKRESILINWKERSACFKWHGMPVYEKFIYFLVAIIGIVTNYSKALAKQ